jgi:hypothetical protein
MRPTRATLMMVDETNGVESAWRSRKQWGHRGFSDEKRNATGQATIFRTEHISSGY